MWPKDCAIPDLAMRLLIQAKKLSCFKEPVFLLLFGVEEVLSDAPEEKSGLWHRFNSLSDSFLGFW